MPLSVERLRECVLYDPYTGQFTSRIRRGRVAVGQVLGCQNNRGYVEISIDSVLYLAHRLAWLYMTGDWPQKGRIDHKDGYSNRWDNLRDATQSQNCGNARLGKHNTSGYKGVSYHKASRKWSASIKCEGRDYYLGLYEAPDTAAAAYMVKAAELFGEFARGA